MAQTSREIVHRAVTFQHPERLPRDLWLLPWADWHHPQTVAEINRRFPGDFATVEYYYPPSTRAQGDPHRAGEYVDEWGCTFVNIQEGLIGEVRQPLLQDIADWRTVQPPDEQLPKTAVEKQSAYDIISRYYEKSDKYVFANICPRPWERYQFIRGSENAYYDIMMPDEGFCDLLRVIHEFNLRELEFWVKSDVDAIRFMDDWGAQQQLLIRPSQWREYFKPLYRDYCDLIHSHGKKSFMHSDGFIQDIYPDLIEVGVDAINSQLFVMDMEYLRQMAKGKITFWGEIDRQHVLPSADPQDAYRAVWQVAEKLYDPAGGLIAQFEFGAGAHPETALAVFAAWEAWEAGQAFQG